MQPSDTMWLISCLLLLGVVAIPYTAHAQPICKIPQVELSCEKETVCPGDTVRCECSVFETATLTWTVNDSLISRYFTTSNVGFIVSDATGAVSNLTFFCENKMNNAIGDFTSTLESVNTSIPLHVECTDQRDQEEIFIQVADSPEMPTTLELYFGDRILLTWDHQCDGTCSYNVSYSSDCRSPGSGITNETRFEIDFADCNELEITLSVAAIDTICGLTSDTATINMSLPPRNEAITQNVTVISPTATVPTVTVPTVTVEDYCDDGGSTSTFGVGLAVGLAVGVAVGVIFTISFFVVIIIVKKKAARARVEKDQGSSQELHEMMQQLCEEKDGALRERDNALEHLRTVSEEKRKAESEEMQQREEKDGAVKQRDNTLEMLRKVSEEKRKAENRVTELQQKVEKQSEEINKLKDVPRPGH